MCADRGSGPVCLVNYLDKSGVGCWYLKMMSIVGGASKRTVFCSVLLLAYSNIMHSDQKGGTGTHNTTMVVTSVLYCNETKYCSKTKCLCYYYKKLQHHSIFLIVKLLSVCICAYVCAYIEISMHIYICIYNLCLRTYRNMHSE